MTNSVTVFSNGLADFIRTYSVKKGQTLDISIPVKKDHVGDVLASLNLFGDVKLGSPPSFSPSNDLNGNLNIDTSNAFYDLATKLSGCKVRVDLFSSGTPLEGILMGVHEETIVGEGQRAEEYYLVVLDSDNKIKRAIFEDIQELNFMDETVQSEINKALQRSFQKVKPNSTFVNLSVVGDKEKDAEAIVQYTVPASAWKISYRLSKVGSKFKLQGLAIVDNSTEEDWKDVYVSVVTGEPITFSTDLAESKTPSRGHVNVVAANAVNAVELERGMVTRKFSGKSISRGVAALACASSFAPTSDLNSLMQYASGDGNLDVHYTEPGLESAFAVDTDSKEVGDFSIFKSKIPLTILANRSAVIPVVECELPDTEGVLHYNESNNATRPYRSVEFKNETESSLGRGVCTVYFDGTYSGSCILPALKQNEEGLMPYALETGVKVKSKTNYTPSKGFTQIKIAKGVLISQRVEKTEYECSIENNKKEKFSFYLDYNKKYSSSEKTEKIEATLNGKKLESSVALSTGPRYKFNLKENDTVLFKVVETRVVETSATINKDNFKWVLNTYVENGPLQNVDVFETSIKLWNDMQIAVDKIKTLKELVTKHTAKQVRLRENIKVGGDQEKKSNWIRDLDDCENRITSIEDEEIPILETKFNTLCASLDTELKKMVADFNA